MNITNDDLSYIEGQTKIILDNGFSAAIKNIKSGNKVLTSNGSLATVKTLLKSTEIKKCKRTLGVKVFGINEMLLATENTFVLTREYKTGKPIHKSVLSLVKGDYLAFPIKEYKNNSRNNKWSVERRNNCPDRLDINYDLGYFVGLFLAEGNLRGKSITFACHDKELEKVEIFLQNFYQFCSSHWTYTSKTSLTRTVTLYSDPLSSFLKNYFFKEGDKFIPDAIFNKGRPFLEGLLRGILDGDGSYINDREITFTSTRENFVIQLKRILISLRFGLPSIHEYEEGMRYGRNCKKSWVIKLMGAGNWKLREHFQLPLPEVISWKGRYRLKRGGNPEGKKYWRRGKEHYWARITSIIEIEEDREFFQLDLEDDVDNYCTQQGVVCNGKYRGF